MHDDRELIEARLDRVLAERIRPATWGPARDLEVTAWEVPGEPVTVNEALAAEFTPFAIGSPFARPWGTTWFRMCGQVPAEWAGQHVQLDVHLGFSEGPGFSSEGLIWQADASGTWVPRRGLHPRNHRVTVASPAVGGEAVDLLVEAASNPAISTVRPDPNSDLVTAGRHPIHSLRRARLAVRHDDVADLVADMGVLAALMRQLPFDQPARHEILRALDAALDALDLTDVVATAAAARAELVEVLSRPAVPSAHRISAIGHAHIDSAWLWPLRETRRKCARTFSNVLRLMDDHPDVRFGCSQAVQYDWMREQYPSIFAGIADRVVEGRWVPIGGMWVEADTNLAGGEALLRQFTHGQRFFREHFDVTCTEVWIPDVFGYPASLPGIMAHAGIDRFLTQKLSWNTTNRFPHHTFWWEGIDGSTVFTHFPPVETYNATFEPHELAHAVRTYAEKGRATRSLLPFGYGDGGGGPSPAMIETYRRVRDLEGMPRIEIESPAEFFDQAIAEYPDAPRWVGELYFEMHRGTFTSQAATKAGNRRSEHLLREAELWAATAALAAGDPASYPAEQLDEIWKTVLLHQFHDILPGSSIGWVHREAEAAYVEVAAELEGLIGEALDALADRAGVAALVANAAPHARDEVAVVDPLAVDGGDPCVQALADGTVAARLAAPALGVAPLAPLPVEAPVIVTEADGAVVLDNGLVRVTLDGDGLISSFVESGTGRELVAPEERANRLEIHPDLPNTYDAWDIEHFNRRNPTVLDAAASVDVVDAGPLVAAVRVVRAVGASVIAQTYELRAGSGRLDVRNEIEWQERERLLQVAFPLDLHTTELTREVQFGHVRTPVHTNTSWDEARFEVCAHRWVEVAEPDFGVALLNDAKYGHHAERGRAADGSPTTTLYLTLLRGPRYPDPEADRGTHRFTYSLLPHAGDLRSAGVVDEGYRLNLPLRVVAPTSVDRSASPAPATPIVAVDHPGVVVEAVKLADDGSGDLVVRCYEAWGTRTRAAVTFGVPVRSVVATDAHEDPTTDVARPAVSWDGTTAFVELRPFRIATLRVAPG